jgi:hypothetical protein
MTAGLSLGAPLAGWAADLLGGWGGFAAVGLVGAALGGAVLALEGALRARAADVHASAGPAPEPAAQPPGIRDETTPEIRSPAVTGSDLRQWSARYQD